MDKVAAGRGSIGNVLSCDDSALLELVVTSSIRSTELSFHGGRTVIHNFDDENFIDDDESF